MRQNALLRLIMRIPVPWVFVLMYLIGVALEQLFPLGTLRVSQAVVGLFGWGLLLTGVLIAGWGWLTFRRARTTTVLVPLVLVYLNWGVIRLEESKLEDTFPEQYAAYRAKVPRWL